MSKMRCRIHGEIDFALVLAGVNFCEACLAEKLLELGIPPVFVVIKQDESDETRTR